MDHVTFWVPVLILAIPKYFHKLLQDCCVAPITALGELGRVMVVAVDLAIMLIIAVLRAKHCWTYRAGKVIYMVFSIKGCDV